MWTLQPSPSRTIQKPRMKSIIDVPGRLHLSAGAQARPKIGVLEIEVTPDRRRRRFLAGVSRSLCLLGAHHLHRGTTEINGNKSKAPWASKKTWPSSDVLDTINEALILQSAKILEKVEYRRPNLLDDFMAGVYHGSLSDSQSASKIDCSTRKPSQPVVAQSTWRSRLSARAHPARRKVIWI